MQGRDKMKVRTRYAPSPTGFMHLGTLYQMMIAFLLYQHF